uniref:Transposase InsH N-terminal domain-containing protein n=1 Tax=candidate division WOR-3 bacterium TaxID=2052148 RepID=A0A7V3RHV0_UNCW3
MPNRQLNFLDFYIAQTITPNDRTKRIFEAINWQEVEKLKPPRKSKKGRKDYDFILMLKALLLIPFWVKPQASMTCTASYEKNHASATSAISPMDKHPALAQS